MPNCLCSVMKIEPYTKNRYMNLHTYKGNTIKRTNLLVTSSAAHRTYLGRASQRPFTRDPVDEEKKNLTLDE